MAVRTAPALSMTDEQRAELTRSAGLLTLSHRKVVRANVVVGRGGVANEEIARRSGVDSDAVRQWRNRFAETGVAGVGVIAKGAGARPGCSRALWPRWCG